MDPKVIVLKEARLTNNCPECYATDRLHLSFVKQKEISAFAERIPKEFTSTMKCQKCHTEIYPGRFTEDIQRVYDYHKKTVLPTKSSVKWKPLFYVVIFILIAVIVLITFYTINTGVLTAD